MARRNPPAKWVLPTVVNPAGRRCIQIPVPDDPAHIAAFRGAMLALASAYNWADDPAHTAKDVAVVWREIIDSLTEWGCNNLPQTILRADPSGCGVQWSLDEGVTWDTIDLSDCISLIASDSFAALFPGAFSDALQQAIADGIVQQNGTQGGPQTAPPLGGCKSFHVVMQARENWICPVPIGPGDSVRVSAASGGWNDGAVYWYCPDGNSYGLSICTPGTAHYEPTDPLTTAHHMTVVGRLADSGDWFDPYSADYVVPAGKPSQLFILQANDQSLSDNYGEIQFDVQVCRSGTLHIVYQAGGMVGPTTLAVGDTFSVTGIHDPNGACGYFSYIWFAFDTSVKLTVLSVTPWGAACNPSNSMTWVNDNPPWDIFTGLCSGLACPDPTGNVYPHMRQFGMESLTGGVPVVVQFKVEAPE